MPVLMQAFRSPGAGRSVAEHVHLNPAAAWPGRASYVESFVILNAAGGDCLEDFDHLRADTGMARWHGGGRDR